MSKLIDLLNQNKLTLIVDLPAGDPQLAKAAVSAGADFVLTAKGFKGVVSLGPRFSLDKLFELPKLGADAICADIIPSEGRGKEMTVGDLQNYIAIVLSATVPVIIPTQRAIRPSEAAIIADTGAKGLMLTSVVTGTTKPHITKAVSEFRKAVDDLF